MDLTTCRGQGYGTEGPISWLTIAEYAAVREYTAEQAEDLFYHVSHMDAAYLEYKAKKLKSSLGGSGDGLKSKKPPLKKPKKR